MLKRRAELYHQLGTMITAGVPLIQALEMTERNPALRGSRKSISTLIEKLKSGMTFTDSMAAEHGWLPEFDMALLSTGEQSGRLDVSFKRLADYYATRAQIIRDTISDLIITMATLHVFLLVFPLGYLIGMAKGIMENNFSECLPFIIEKIVVFGSMYGVAFFLIFAGQGNRGERWRAMIESLAQMVPLLRTAQKYLALSRLAGSLEALISAGVSIIKSWELAGPASGSPRIKYEISRWKPDLENGKTPAEVVQGTPYFPEMFMNLYHTGETSGKLDETLARLQAYYHEEGFRTLRMFTRIMNGMIYGVIVMLVAYNVIHFYVGYFNSAVNAF
ncbi:MAG TPA: type II secretion system F family protein [Verrucomicrobiae bacterium]